MKRKSAPNAPIHPCGRCGKTPVVSNKIIDWFFVVCPSCNFIVYDPKKMDFPPLESELPLSRARAIRKWNMIAG